MLEVVDYSLSPESKGDSAKTHSTPVPVTRRLVKSTVINQHDFYQEVVTFFEPYRQTATFRKVFDWVCISHSLKYFSRYLRVQELVEVYIECIFSLFEDYCCRDRRLVQHIFERYLQNKYVKSYVFRPMKSNHYGHAEEGHQNFECQDASDHCLILRNIDVAISANEDSYSSWSSDCHLRPVFYRDLQATQRLLRYGMPLQFHLIISPSYIRHVLGRLGNGPSHLFLKYDSSGCLTLYPSSLYPTFQSQRRMHIIFIGIDVISQKRETEQCQYYRSAIEKLKLYFKTTAEPLITVEEISRFLNFFTMGENKETDIKNFCDEFIEEFPESVQPIQPRRLQHFCRLSIRQRLKQRENLPYGVYTLNLPRRMKDYILFQRTEHEFKTKR